MIERVVAERVWDELDRIETSIMALTEQFETPQYGCTLCGAPDGTSECDPECVRGRLTASAEQIRFAKGQVELAMDE